jgi:hypothetical protein
MLSSCQIKGNFVGIVGSPKIVGPGPHKYSFVLDSAVVARLCLAGQLVGIAGKRPMTAGYASETAARRISNKNKQRNRANADLQWDSSR